MLNKVLLDTNILIDILWDRSPNIQYVKELFELGSNEYCFSTQSILDAYYIAKVKNQKKYQELLERFTILNVEKETLGLAFSLEMNDFEDATQLACALLNNCESLITWNTKDFKENITSVRISNPKMVLMKS